MKTPMMEFNTPFGATYLHVENKNTADARFNLAFKTTTTKQQTPVEWLKEQYIDRGETIPSGVFQQAKEMEKEQIKLIVKTQSELIEILKNQVADLVMMSKIELGDDVILEINRLQKLIRDINKNK